MWKRHRRGKRRNQILRLVSVNIFIVFPTCLRCTKGSFNRKCCRHVPHVSCKPAEGIVRSFGIETLNTFVHSRGSLESHDRFQQWFQTKMSKVYTRFQTKTAQNLTYIVLYVNWFFSRLNCPITYLLVFRQLARKWLKWDLHHRVYFSAKGEVKIFWSHKKKKDNQGKLYSDLDHSTLALTFKIAWTPVKVVL